MQRLLLSLALVAAAPSALAQNVLGPNRFLSGGTTCGQFAAMDTAARLRALRAIEPLGDDIEGADPALAGQWADEVDAACQGRPERPLADAAAQALGGG